MIDYLARTIPIILHAQAQRPNGPYVSRLRRRVSVRQVDLNLHMNQAAYPQVMELGRTDWIIASGAWRRWRAQGINPVVAEQNLVYRRELKPFERYTIDTRGVAIEGKLLVLESYLFVGDRVHTKGIAKLIFVGPEGVLPAESVPALLDGILNPPMPVEDWRVVGQ